MQKPQSLKGTNSALVSTRFASGRRVEPQDERYSFESCEEPAYVLPLQQE
jgi:hypothetical protein